MKNKLIIFLLLPLLFISVVGCGNSSDSKTEPFAKKEKQNDSANKKDNNQTTNKQKAKIEETVIMDRDNIKITAKSINYDGFMGPEIKLLIENNSDKNITVQTDNFTINDLVVDALFSADVAAGKKATDEITLSEDELKMSNINTIKEIEFDINVMEEETYDDIFVEKNIVIKTDAKNYTQKYNTYGTLLVNQDGIIIYILGLAKTDSIFGKEVILYIENNNDQEYTVQVDNFSVNGFMATTYFSATIPAHKKAYDTITISDDDLKENDIDKIEDIEFIFKVFNFESWDDLFSTDTIKYEFK